ncbi:MAG: hypothetical protein AAFY26_06025 [Cyanobacteria bacterium J06638_22]
MLESLSADEMVRYRALQENNDWGDASRQRALPKNYRETPRQADRRALKQLTEGRIIELMQILPDVLEQRRSTTCYEMSLRMRNLGHPTATRSVCRIVATRLWQQGGLAKMKDDRFALVGEGIAKSVLDVLVAGDAPRTSWEVQCRLRDLEQYFIGTDVTAVLKQLAASGQILSVKTNALRYRKHLPKQIGLPVIEHVRTPSERPGYIERWGYNVQRQAEYPIVRFLDGTSSFSTDESLTPLPPDDPRTSPKVLAWIEHMKAGDRPTPPIRIPDEIIRGLNHCRTTTFTVPTAALARVGHVLGILPEELTILVTSSRRTETKKILDYLDTYYPGWAYGANADRWKLQASAIAS